MNGPKEKFSRVEQVLSKIDRKLWAQNYEIWDHEKKLIDKLKDEQ